MYDFSDYYSLSLQQIIDRILNFEKEKILTDECEADIYKDVVSNRLIKLGFDESEVNFKIRKKRFLWIFESSKVIVSTEMLTDEIITAMKIIG